MVEWGGSLCVLRLGGGVCDGWERSAKRYGGKGKEPVGVRVSDGWERSAEVWLNGEGACVC